MRRVRQNPEVVVLRHVWPALAFAAAWLWFPHTLHVIGLPYEYALLVLIAAVTFFRARVALKRPNASILKYMPIADAALLTLLIRFTGGIRSDLWLFYYFLLIAGAMDPRPRTIELIAPLVIISYIAATVPGLARWDWEVVETIGTRLFFLFLTGLITRQIALARSRLSEELALLSEQLSLSQERIRIAREIHDGVGHSLVNCILTLELCERLVGKSPEEACKVIQQEKSDLRAALESMRDYVHHLHPVEVESEEFVPLVKKYAARFSDRTGLETRLHVRNKSIDLPPSSRLVLLRIMQEALSNAAKHSEASEVDISLARTGDRGVHCVITDNGHGFDEKEVLQDPSSRQGFGLRTMKDRATGVGGDAQIESSPGAGTRVSVYIPG
jgi:signal transduction histidine kinase